MVFENKDIFVLILTKESGLWLGITDGFQNRYAKIIGDLKVVYQARWSVNTRDRGLIIKE